MSAASHPSSKPRVQVKFLITILTVASFAVITLKPNQAHAQNAEGRVVIVKMVDNSTNEWRFEPEVVMVHPGDTIRWVQEDVAPHNVEFKMWPKGVDLGEAQMGPFLIQKGEAFELTIDERFKEGEYTYVCTPHEPMDMKAVIKVMTMHDHDNN